MSKHCALINLNNKCSCTSTPYEGKSELELKYEQLYLDLLDNKFPMAVQQGYLQKWLKTLQGINLYNESGGLIEDIKSSVFYTKDADTQESSATAIIGKMNAYIPKKNITFTALDESSEQTVEGYCDIEIETPDVTVISDNSAGEIVNTIESGASGTHSITISKIKNNKTNAENTTGKLYLIGAANLDEEQVTGSKEGLWVEELGLDNLVTLCSDNIITKYITVANDLTVNGNVNADSITTNEITYTEGGETKHFISKVVNNAAADFVSKVELNGDTINVTNSAITAGDGISITKEDNGDIKISSGIVSFPVPIGSIVMWPGTISADGHPEIGGIEQTDWLICDGREINAGDYPDLAAVIGTIYDPGQSVTRLPNLVQRFPLGAGSTRTLASTDGAEEVTLTTELMPRHGHSISYYRPEAGDHGSDTTVGAETTSADTGSYIPWGSSIKSNLHVLWTADPTGGDSSGNTVAHNNMPPYLAINFIIKIE